MALKDGTMEGFHYMGVDHYVSNSHTANHVFAGVKGLMHLGILKGTYGQVVIDQEPVLKSGSAATIGAMSGIGIVTRLDWEYKVWTNTKPLLFDLAVA
jgi:hypothetical protein